MSSYDCCLAGGGEGEGQGSFRGGLGGSDGWVGFFKYICNFHYVSKSGSGKKLLTGSGIGQ